ncbi:hypothetical protein [Paenibacillus sp. KN14-4R]|uniref:hypothetical protein n=1 Tax=Paenibacillus sp. KN14-4R TaxID=3445773 RepID=UPI003F9F811E
MNPNPGFLPYFLALFPGIGHFYQRKYPRSLAYGIPFWGIVLLFFFAIITHGPTKILVTLFIGDVILWIICLIDAVMCIQRTLSLYNQQHSYMSSIDPNMNMGDPLHDHDPYWNMQHSANLYPRHTDSSKIILLSIVPGLAHFYLGLMKRGLTTMTLFVSVPIFLSFVSGMTGRGSFMAFLLILPVIWFYSLFDALHLFNKKMNGEMLSDQSFFEDLYQNRAYDTKNRTVATLLSIFPGAGHLYLGAQKRGIQLMIAFLLSLYMLDMIRLSLFLFLVPIIWFFSFFDSLQLISKYETYGVEDRPMIGSQFGNYRRLLGLGLIVLAITFVFNRLDPGRYGTQVFDAFGVHLSGEEWQQWRYYYYFIKDNLQIVFVAGILIVGGLVLLLRKNKNSFE